MRLDIEVLVDADRGGPVKRAAVVPSEAGGLFLIQGVDGEGQHFKDLVTRRVGLFGLSNSDIELLDRKLTSPETYLIFDIRNGGMISAGEKVEELIAEIDDGSLARGGTWMVISSFREFAPVRPTL